MEQLHDPEHEADSRRRLANPEDKHPLRERGLELRELLVHTRKADLHLGPQLGTEPVDLCFQLGALPVYLCFQLDNALLELGIEASEVQLVQLTQLRSVGRIHHVEPVHELVGNIVPKPLIELAGQLGGDRHTSSWWIPVHYTVARRRLGSTKRTRHHGVAAGTSSYSRPLRASFRTLAFTEPV